MYKIIKLTVCTCRNIKKLIYIEYSNLHTYIKLHLYLKINNICNKLVCFDMKITHDIIFYWYKVTHHLLALVGNVIGHFTSCQDTWLSTIDLTSEGRCLYWR